ncbi:hypothetical protein GC170_11000 [bacterium]|nr:hypothetical protein [bacterium]
MFQLKSPKRSSSPLNRNIRTKRSVDEQTSVRRSRAFHPLAFGLDAYELESRQVMTATAIGLNFAGASGNNLAPPDTMGSIGPNSYAQFLNGRWNVYDKTTGANLQSRTDTQFWASVTGITPNDYASGLSDPRIIYDSQSDRWFALQINVSNTANKVLIARSNTNDPTGGWRGTSYVGNAGFADYPTLGVDNNGVYVGTINFTSSVGSVSSIQMTSIPKADLLAATPSVARRSTFDQTSFALGYILQGVTNFAPISTSTPANVLGINAFNYGQINLTPINGTSAAGATLGATSVLTVQMDSDPYLSRQPDGTRQIDAIDGRIGSMVYQVGDLIYSARGYSSDASGNAISASTTSHNAIRITILKSSTGKVVAENSIFSSTYDYSYPSIAANATGDIIIGYTRSSDVQGSGATNGNLGSYYRYASIDPSNPTSISLDATDNQLKAGLVNNYHLFGGNDERWGDYSATGLDPSNPTSFWTTQEYAAGASLWGTQISQIYVPARSSNVTSTVANGVYTPGATIPITLAFNDAVTVTGTPTLSLNSGGTAVYASGSGSKTLTFNYVVGAGEQSLDLDYTSTSALALAGGTIKGAASGLDANLVLAAPGAPGSLGANKNIIIVPAIGATTVNNVSSTAPDYTYGLNSLIPIQLTFSDVVTVTGTPTLALNSGGTATYASGSGTNTLVFNYTVGAGQFSPDLDYPAAYSLSGSIKDSSGNLIDYQLPAPGGIGSLGYNNNIVIDGSLPVSSISGWVYDVDTNTGLARVRVYNDVNGNGKFDGSLISRTSTGAGLRVLDLKTVTKSLIVSGAALPIYGMTVNVTLPHTHVGDLIVTLISPSGTRVRLLNRQGADGQNLKNAVFDDSADAKLPNSIVNYTGSYIPFDSLSALNGQTANGTWTLEVSDNAFGDVGALTGFAVNITSTSEPNVFTNKSGNYQFLNAAAGNWKLRVDLSNNPTWNVVNPVSGQINYTQPNGGSVGGLYFGIKRPLTIASSQMGMKLGGKSSFYFMPTTQETTRAFNTKPRARKPTR